MARRRRDRRPKLAVWKFASCDGCQLSLLDCEAELLSLAERLEFAYFPEASSVRIRGPYELSLVEGSIGTPDDAERIRRVRRVSRHLVAIGACATAGGIQALRNRSDAGAFATAVYPRPELIATSPCATAVADHVAVDLELPGCPVSKLQLLEVVDAFLRGRRPDLPSHPVCVECKRRGAVCVMVAAGTPCLGPVTRAGCGALCPAWGRGCYGCFGPSERPNMIALLDRWTALGIDREDRARALRAFTCEAPAFRDAALKLQERDTP